MTVAQLDDFNAVCDIFGDVLKGTFVDSHPLSGKLEIFECALN